MPSVSSVVKLPKSLAMAPASTGIMKMPKASTDRELQDEIIRYLTDASSQPAAVLNPSEAEKAQRFSRFLARRYYRDRLHRAFRYSRNVSNDLPARVEDLVDSAEFDSFLSRCMLGSLLSAREVGEMAIARLLEVKAPGPWWPELLQYEFSFFVQLATSEIDTQFKKGFPATAKSTIVREFSWKMPALLALFKSGQVPAEDLRGRTVLLFSRTHHGKIYVVELDATAMKVINAANGEGDVVEIASAASIPEAHAQQILASLGEIGAVTLG